MVVAETLLYDNSLGSRLLFEARAGALRTLVYRERFDPKVVSTMCRACREEPGTVEHLVLYCECLLPTPLVDRWLHSEAMLACALGFKTTADSDNLCTVGTDDPPHDRHDISTMQARRLFELALYKGKRRIIIIIIIIPLWLAGLQPAISSFQP
ncbi:hypothetical protein HPB47_002493 [Ixodes persulcatus]|uniref:Uncharacterized protein n=1 Tax=Ixodes persulcatus TaxID=34615 RepID=A0AC60PL87_IXOPE|nr:hypothetical protein HPB47_002493 [Ixodes persulcatus]